MRVKIFLLITLLNTLAFNVAAQSIKNPPKTLRQEEIDKKEIVKFADELVKILEKTKDIGLIPNKFLDNEFKPNLIKTHKSDFLRELKFIDKVSDAEFYDFFRLSLNFFYLAVSINNGLCCDSIKIQNNPPNILKIIKRNKFLSGFYNESSGEPTINNIAELNDIKYELKEITKAQRKYLEGFSFKKKAIIRKNWLSTIDKFDCLRIFQCKDEDCENYPQGTKMAEFCQFPLTLRIVNDGKSYKIVNIYFYSQ